MTKKKDQCLPIPSSPVSFIPDADCPDCGECDECNCSLTDIVWNINPTPCMAQLGFYRNQPLSQIIIGLSALACETDTLDCSDIEVPESYPNIGYDGTEHTCTYDISAFTFPDDFTVVVDDVTEDLGTITNTDYLLIALNNLGKGSWTLTDDTITVVGYHDYGVMVGNSTVTPSCETTGTAKDLCDLIEAVDNRFEEIQIEIDNISAPLPNVLESDNTASVNTITDSYEAVKTYTVAANTLVNDGDKLIVETNVRVTGAKSSTGIISSELTFGGSTIYIGGRAGISSVRLQIELIRKNTTTIFFKCTEGDYINGSHASFIFSFNNVAGYDFTVSNDIEVLTNSSVIGNITVDFLDVDILRA